MPDAQGSSQRIVTGCGLLRQGENGDWRSRKRLRKRKSQVGESKGWRLGVYRVRTWESKMKIPVKSSTLMATHHRSVFLLAVLLTAPALAELAPRSGWVFVPGAQDLIQAGQWACLSQVVVNGSSLTVSAGTGYNTVLNSTGPVLQVQGDFSVLATLSAPSGTGTFLTLVGALNTGSDWWNGLKRLDVGLTTSGLLVNYWAGSSANQTSTLFQLQARSDPLNLEVARIAGQVV